MGSGEPSLAQPDPATLARWREVAEAFALPGRWLSSRPYGSGWINETLLVEREQRVAARAGSSSASTRACSASRRW